MSRLRQALVQYVPFGGDPFDDPLNQSWDAIVSRTTAVPPGAVPDDIAFLRHAHALDIATMPSPGFLGDLEQRLRDLYPAPVSNPDRESGVANPTAGTSQSAPKRLVSQPRTHRMAFMPAALGAILLVLVTILGVFYFAAPSASEPTVIPAAIAPEPTLQPLVQFDVAPRMYGFPDATTWTHMYFNLIQIDPGTSFATDTDWYTSIDGPLLILVLSGELTMHPAGPARLYPDYQRDQTSEDIAPGQSVSLGAGAAIVYSAVDSATGSNPGSEPVTALQLSIGQLTFSGPGTESSPIDIRVLDTQKNWGLDPLPTEDVSISIQQLQLAPLDSFVFEPDPQWTYLCVFDPMRMDGVRMANGAFDGLTPNVETDRLYASTQLTYPDPGPNTIFNLGAETVEFYFLVLEPLPDEGALPA